MAHIRTTISLESLKVTGEIGIASQLGDQRWRELKEKIKGDAIEIMKKRVKLVCDEVENEITSCPILIEEIVVKRGYSVNKILCEAENRNCDVVVMGCDYLPFSTWMGGGFTDGCR